MMATVFGGIKSLRHIFVAAWDMVIDSIKGSNSHIFIKRLRILPHALLKISTSLRQYSSISVLKQNSALQFIFALYDVLNFCRSSIFILFGI